MSKCEKHGRYSCYDSLCKRDEDNDQQSNAGQIGIDTSGGLAIGIGGGLGIDQSSGDLTFGGGGGGFGGFDSGF